MQLNWPIGKRIRLAYILLGIYGLILLVFSVQPEARFVIGPAKIDLGGFESTVQVFFAVLAICIALIGRTARRQWFLPSTRRQHAWTAFLILMFTYAVYVVNNRAPQEGDTLTSKLLPLAILERGELTMDIARDFFEVPPQMIVEVDGVWLGSFPLGTGVMAVPMYAMAEFLNPGIGQGFFLQQLEKNSAAWIAAASAVLFFYLCLHLFRPGTAWLGYLIFAFGSQQWAISSQNLWQHGPSVFCLLLCLCLLTRRGRWIWLLGIPLVFALFVRPSNALWALPVGLYACWKFRFALWPAVLIGLPLAIAVVYVHLDLYGHLLGPYAFHSNAKSWDANIWHAGKGHLVSASRGILVFMPLVLFAPFGAWLGLRDPERRSWYVLVVTCVFLWWMMIIRFGVWYGGYCYGPRLQTELAPLYTLLVLPLFDTGRFRRLWPVLGLCTAWGFYIQFAGIYTPAARIWNKTPSVQKNQHRLWDWKEPQWLAWWQVESEPAQKP